MCHCKFVCSDRCPLNKKQKINSPIVSNGGFSTLTVVSNGGWRLQSDVVGSASTRSNGVVPTAMLNDSSTSFETTLEPSTTVDNDGWSVLPLQPGV
jgi:hypothetical protein